MCFFVAMGDSNLAAKSILPLPDAKLGKRTFLLASIDPDSIRGLDEKLRLDKTLFIFANKSGKHMETHSLLLYFLARLRMVGIHSPARHFVSLTEENSYLGELAGEYDFLDRLLDPPCIHGRYWSLIHFNFFLAALCRLDPSDLHARTRCAMPVVPLHHRKRTLPYRSLLFSRQRNSRGLTGWSFSPRAA